METTAEALGHPADAKLLILSADLLGSTHAATAGGFTALREGMATTATVMMPGPWSRYAADRDEGADIGVHLTLNSQLDCYRWGPLTAAPSLLDGDGGFPRTADDLWDHADLDEVRRECRAQLERARLWGFDVTHLSTHMGTLQQRPEFFDVLLDIAYDAELPVRLESGDAEDRAGFPFRRLAAEEGVLLPDHFTLVRGGARDHLDATLASLESGVTVVAFEPAIAAEELRAIDPDASSRMDDLDVLTDRGLGDRIAATGATLIGFREMRDAQRARR
ncbi:MAG: ChbG/HpnK family deacetylase [Acidimicrobiales bacterium]|nr:ChbG/HpnK family deacetylase [Acidimicrobiales bacterium]